MTWPPARWEIKINIPQQKYTNTCAQPRDKDTRHTQTQNTEEIFTAPFYPHTPQTNNTVKIDPINNGWMATEEGTGMRREQGET